MLRGDYATVRAINYDETKTTMFFYCMQKLLNIQELFKFNCMLQNSFDNGERSDNFLYTFRYCISSETSYKVCMFATISFT